MSECHMCRSVVDILKKDRTCLFRILDEYKSSIQKITLEEVVPKEYRTLQNMMQETRTFEKPPEQKWPQVKTQQQIFQDYSSVEPKGQTMQKYPPTGKYHKSYSQIHYCQEHQGEEIQYYCKNCMVPLCYYCVITNEMHKGHEVTSLQKYSTECRTYFTRLVPSTEDDLKYCQSLIRALDESPSNASLSQKMEVKQQLTNTMNQIIFLKRDLIEFPPLFATNIDDDLQVTQAMARVHESFGNTIKLIKDTLENCKRWIGSINAYDKIGKLM